MLPSSANGLLQKKYFTSKKVNGIIYYINGTIYGGAAKRLVIEICEYARKNGFKFVDLGGVDLSGNEKSGISEYLPELVFATS